MALEYNDMIHQKPIFAAGRSRFIAIIVGYLCGLPFTAFASTFNSDGSQADVQSKINSAVDGDTVTIPSGLFTWTGGVTISGKGIKLQGAGGARVVARSNTAMGIGTGTKVFTLTTETLTALEALKSQITNGTTLKIWRTGGAVSGGSTTGAIPWMLGTVSSLNGTTLTMAITDTNSSGTHPNWIIATIPATTIVDSIVSGSASALITATEDASNSVEITGIGIEHAATLSTANANSANFITVNGTSGGQPILIHDCLFIIYTYGDQIHCTSQRGIVWNCSFVSLPYSRAPLAIHNQANSFSTSWTTASTMGTTDLTGKNNFYVEDCDFHAWANATDFDENARSVMRRCLFNNSGWGSHGADSSSFGQRHFDVYDCVFFRNNYGDGQTLNVTQFFLLRGGTGIIADNVIPAFSGADYGSAPSIKLALWNLQYNGGPNPLWGKDIAGIQYPCPRQIGFGRVTGSGTDGNGRTNDAITYVGDSEPLYIWGNTGTYTVVLSSFNNVQAGEDSIADYIQAGRDYFNNGTAKPGYTQYPYPHPLRVGPTIPPSNAIITIIVE